MKALHLPYSSENPYQQNLAGGLAKLEVTVYYSTGRAIPTLRSMWKHGLPDVLHIHWLAPFLIGDSLFVSLIKSLITTVGLAIAKVLGISVVWTIHELIDHKRQHPALEVWMKRVLVRTLIDAVIVHSDSAMGDLIDTLNLPPSFSEKISVIPHGHYIDNYPNVNSQDSARSTLDLDRHHVVFLFFGLIRPYKQVPYLVDEFKSIEEDTARLLIVGNPTTQPLRAEIESKTESDSRIHTEFRYVPDDEVQIYMNAADTVVLPYEYIRTSGSVVLGMSFGKAIIAPEIGDIPELLDERGSLLYDPSDDDGLRDSIQSALSADLDRMGDHNLELARELSWEEIAADTYELYARLSESD